jgi:HlyD family secretion protein
MKKVLRISLIVILLATFAGTIYFLYKKSEKKQEVFKIEKPSSLNILKKTVATGAVVPRKEIDIKPRVSGIIEKLFVEAGQVVKTGDMIARVKIIPNMVSLNEAESRLNRANINFGNAKTEYERMKKLYDQKVISAAEFQRTELSYNNAKEEQETADNNLQLIKEGTSRSVGNAANTIIRATISGTVLNVPVKEGNSVIESNTFNEGTTIATIADMSDMIFQGKVDESEVGKIKTGMALIVTIGAIETDKYDAHLEYISPKGVTEDGAIQFEIKAAMKLKPGSFIRAGYSANADIVLDRRDSVLSIPESLLKFEGEQRFVEVETTPQTFKKQYITTGLSDGINIEVLSGIDKNARLKGAVQEANATEEKPKE